VGRCLVLMKQVFALCHYFAGENNRFRAFKNYVWRGTRSRWHGVDQSSVLLLLHFFLEFPIFAVAHIDDHCCCTGCWNVLVLAPRVFWRRKRPWCSQNFKQGDLYLLFQF
jgi:hypothetical protein